MKFITNREQLLLPLQQLVNVIEKRQTMPVLANLLMVIEDNTLILTGTDLEIQLVITLHLDQAERGKITVPARKFLDIVRLLPREAEINCELVDNTMKIISGRSRFRLLTLDANNYPEFPESNFDHTFHINAEKLKFALNKTLFAMANQDIRYYLNGMLLNISNSIIKLIASDGHRLALFEDKIGNLTGYEARVILPRKCVIELARLLNNDELDIDVQFSNTNIKFIIEHLIFSAKLVDAKYPNFNRVYEQGFLAPIHLQKTELIAALTRVAILANEKFKGVNCEFSNGLLKLDSHNPEHDEAEEELAIEYQDTPLKIAFNAQYLLDAINNLEAQTVILTLAQNGSCCFIEEEGEKPYRYIVMSMKI